MARGDLFQTTPEMQAAKDRVWAAFDDTPEGTIISWADFDAEAWYDHRSHPVIYTWFRDEMMRRRKRLVAVQPYVGLLICNDRQQATIPMERRIGRAKRQMKRVLKETETVNRENLELHERRLLEAERVEAEKHMDKLGAIERAHDQATRPSKTIPLPRGQDNATREE